MCPLPVPLADRDYLKAVQQPFTMPPPEVHQRHSPNAPAVHADAASRRAHSQCLAQVTLQCILATFIGIWGILGLKGTFLPIRTTAALAKQ